MHRIYLAAMMGYGLGSDDPEELAYYKKLRKEMEDMKKDPVKKGIPLSFEINKGKDKWTWTFFVNWWEFDAYWITSIDDSQSQKEDSLSQ